MIKKGGVVTTFLRYLAQSCIAGFGFLFYGFIAAVLAMKAFGLEEEEALLCVGLPVGLIFVAFTWKKLPKILRLDEWS